MLKESEIKALVVLLDDEDDEVVSHVEEKIMSLGTSIIPLLEQEWESTFNPIVQGKIEDIVHELQFELLKERFLEWKDQEDNDLLEGLWIVATYLYPDLEINELNQELDQLYHELWRHMEDQMAPYDRVKVFNEVFFKIRKSLIIIQCVLEIPLHELRWE